MNSADSLASHIVSTLAMTPFDMAAVNGYLWFSAVGFNGLCCVHPQTGETKFLGSFPEEEKDKTFLHSQVCYCDGKLVFSPNFSKGIDIYDIEAKRFERIELPADIVSNYGGEHTKTYAMHQTGHKFVLLGFFQPIIIFFDLLTRKVNIEQNMYEKLYGSVYNRNLPVFKKSSCLAEGCTFGLCAQSNQLIIVDMALGTYELWNGIEKQFDTISYDGEYFWLSSDNDIFRMKNYVIEKIISLETTYKFVLSKCIGNYIYFIANDKEEIVIVDKKEVAAFPKLLKKRSKDIIPADDGGMRVYNGILESENHEAVIICEYSNTIFFMKNGQVDRTVDFIFEKSIPELELVAVESLMKWGNAGNLYEENLKLWLWYISALDSKMDENKSNLVCTGVNIYQDINEVIEKKHREE